MQNRATEIVLVPLEEIRLNPNNRNKHSPEQIAQFVKILKYQGFRNPGVISNRSGHLIAGEGRYLALKEMGATHMPCTRQDFEDEEQEYLYGVSDNAIASQAELDLSAIHVDIGQMGPFDLDLLGIKDFQFEPSPDAQGDPDAVPEVPKVAKTKRGELWLLGEHRLLIDDCTVKENVERLMGGERADMVFTDPPYGLDFISKSGVLSEKYEQYAGEESQDTYLKSFAVLKEFAIDLIFWGGNFVADRLPGSTYWIVWNKQGDNMKAGGPATDQTDCEIAWTNMRFRKVKQYQHVWAGWFRAGNRKDELKTKVHPSQKPVALAEFVFADHPGGSVLDAFLGSGSTLIACEKTNRRCFGMEIEPLYGDVILSRWAKFTGKDPQREDGLKWSALNGTPL